MPLTARPASTAAPVEKRRTLLFPVFPSAMSAMIAVNALSESTQLRDIYCWMMAFCTRGEPLELDSH